MLRFTVPLSLRDSVLFLLKQYPAAGYVLGRGDSEQDEADAPFAHGALHGKTRITAIGPCTTTWLVAVSGTVAGLGRLQPLAPHTETDSP